MPDGRVQGEIASSQTDLALSDCVLHPPLPPCPVSHMHAECLASMSWRGVGGCECPKGSEGGSTIGRAGCSNSA